MSSTSRRRPRRLHAFLLMAAAAVVFAGCTTHIAPYRAKRRTFKPGKYDTVPKAQSGSLYARGARGLFEDNTASRIGDTLVIRIDERETATRDAKTKLNKKDESQYAIPKALGLMAVLQAKLPNIDPAQLLSTESESKFTGDGSISRKGQLSATLPVRVRRVLPNGDLYVEGTKVVMVAQEEHHIYVSGIVRPWDIKEDNSVSSSRVADAEIEYTGRGDVSDTQRRGWLTRVVSTLWPF